MRAIVTCNFKAPTEIQRQAIPIALAGRDLMASAQTGTGKTAAFVLPALQRLLTPSAVVKGRGPRVLVLTPTRELAMQINDHVTQFSKFCQVTTGNIVGGLPYPKQIRMLQMPLDILVATPGRLMDHMEQGRVDFSRLEMLVLDEADRMLDMGFVDAVKSIAAKTPASRQTLLFSATLEGRIMDIASKLLKDPARIQLAANKDVHTSITQKMHQADDATHKHALLSHLLKGDGLFQTVIFTATKHGADKLAKRLSGEGHISAALHGDMNQNARKRTVDQMRRNKFNVLVATDVAARGLDIAGISHVINFDLPMVAEDYIHRIGRTGRGSATGTAISLVCPEDRNKLRDIERLTGRKLESEIIVGLEPKRPFNAPIERSGRGGGRNDRNSRAPSSRAKSYPPRDREARPARSSQASPFSRSVNDYANAVPTRAVNGNSSNLGNRSEPNGNVVQRTEVRRANPRRSDAKPAKTQARPGRSFSRAATNV